MNDAWVVTRRTPNSFGWGGVSETIEYLTLDGPFAYPTWGSTATILGKSEAHQHAMGFGSPHSLANHIAIPAKNAIATLQSKWVAKTARELRGQ